MERAHRLAQSAAATRREKTIDGIRFLLANVAFAVCVAVVAYYLFLTYQVKQHEALLKAQEVQAMRVDLDRTLAQNEQLRLHAEFLRTREGVEKVAREKLGLICPFETTYVVVNAPVAREPDVKLADRVRSPQQEARCVHNFLVRPFHVFWNGGD